MKLAVFIVLASLALSEAKETKALHPAAGLTLVELVEYYGYPIEVHEDIQTEDGYLLTMHRIPHGKNNADQENKPVALLMHCLTCSSAVYAAYGPENGLAFILADQGYDVWMPNARGNFFSRKHISLDPEDAEFWKFSWHQIGNIDLPTSIDYIQEQTGVEKMSYVGYSQGTTSFYIMGSTRPEYNDKINVAVSLAPIGYMTNMSNSMLVYLSQYIFELEELIDMIGWNEFLPNTGIWKPLFQWCKGNGQELCDSIFTLLFGKDTSQMDDEWMLVFLTHVPAGCSANQFTHYGQEIQSGHFRQYDFGLDGNLEAYGSENPPDYDTSKITAPTAFLYGQNDSFAAVEDVEQLINEVPNVVFHKLYEGYNHIDFVFSEERTAPINQQVVEILNSYSP